MKHVQIRRRRDQFALLTASSSAQAALMTLAPGEASDTTPSNEHPLCEQWVFVVSGRGTVVAIGRQGSRRTQAINKSSLLSIQKRERHQIKNTGSVPLRTINLYVPPAYGGDGEPLISATARKRPRA